MLRPHQPANAFDAIVDVAIRARLRAITPHFDLTAIGGEGDFAANSGWGFFAAAIVGAEWTEDVVEAGDASFQAEVFGVMSALALAEELLPAIAIFGISGIRVFFFER